MNKLNKLFSTIFALTLLVALPVGTALAADEANPVVHNLQAGNDGTFIGTVSVWNDGTNLYVEFAVDDSLAGGGYELLKTQVLATDDNKLKGALATGAPGQFPYEHFPVDDPKFDRFEISLAELGVASADDLIVAFHANVQNLNNIIGYEDSDGVIHEEAGQDCPTLGDIAAALPEYTTMQLFGDGSGYYDVKIDLNGDGAFATDGSESFDWYCIDRTHTIGLGVYTVRVFSSYETLPDEIINNGTGDNNLDSPENLDLVNWVINNPGNPVAISQVQQQDVIWALVDDAVTRDSLDSDEVQVYDAAVANGEGFEPTADGQNLAIVLQPVDASNNSVGQVTIGQVTIGQVTFGSLGLECVDWTPVYKGDTAWAISAGDDGKIFPRGNNWGLYYEYGVTE
jgi:hypothetical protein